MVYDGPILDNHFHLNRQGLFLDAARDFQRVGGTDLVLVHCPDFSAPPETLEGHRAAYADTLGMAQSVREKVGLGVRVVLGPHPAAFAHQFERWVSEDGEAGKERAVENYRHSIQARLTLYTRGKPTPSVKLAVRTGPYRMRFGNFPMTSWTKRCTLRRRKAYRSNFTLREKARTPIPI